MIVYTPTAFWRLMFNQITQQLMRVTDNGFCTLTPKITKAYLDYQVEKILLENNI